MYCSQAATTVIQLFAASVVNKLIYHFMDQHYGELQFAHTFSQKITKVVHKLTPCIASDLALEIILNSSISLGLPLNDINTRSSMFLSLA